MKKQRKKIIGFREKEIENDDDICPNCGRKTSKFPVGVTEYRII